MALKPAQVPKETEQQWRAEYRDWFDREGDIPDEHFLVGERAWIARARKHYEGVETSNQA